MNNKKDLIIAILAAFCLTATIFMVVPTRSAYDPSLNIDEASVDCIVGGRVLVWKDTPDRVLAFAGQTEHVSWTDLDLTNSTSGYAKIAYLWLTITVVTMNKGYSIHVRKTGTDPCTYPKAIIYGEEAHSGDTVQAPVIVGLDPGQACEFTIVVDSGGEAHSSVWVLAYWE